MAGQYRFKDINGNIVAQISASAQGAIVFSGSAVDFSNASTITLGQVQLAGTASNALLLDGFDSTAFVFTSSFNTISQSISSQLTTLQTTSGSNIGRLNNLESKSSSVDISISNINSVTESVLSRTSNLESKSSSVDISISNINSFTASNSNTSLNNLTGSLATTGSNTFFGTQTYSGSVYIATDLIVQGSSSIQYISASSVSIGTNIVQLNTATPSVRYAGISVQDSGSSAGVTGSMLWDSLCNRWIYSNPSTIGYSGGMLLSGPRASTLGSETTLTCNYIAKSGGGDHLYDSCIYESSGCVGIGTSTPCTMLHVEGQATIGCSTYRTRIDGSSSGAWISFGTLACSNLLGRIGTFDSLYVLDSNNGNISFRFAGVEKAHINSAGLSCFSGMIIGTNCKAFGRNLTVQGDVVAYYSDTENITMGISAGTGAQSWGIQVCDTVDGGSALHLNARGGNVGINKGAGITADYPLDVTGTIRATASGIFGGLTVNGAITAGTLYTTTQRLVNTAGNYANMIHKVQGASGSFSQVVICVSLNGAGGWGYIINGGGTGGGVFQSGGGYTNGTANYSHSSPVGGGYTVSSPASDVIRFIGPGGVHPFTSIQMFGSLSQNFGDQHVCIYYS